MLKLMRPGFGERHTSKSLVFQDVLRLPPVHLIPQVLKNFLQEQMKLILTTSHWPKKAWFSQLLSLSANQPLPLPHMEDLMRQGPLAGLKRGNFNCMAWLFRSTSKG